MEYLIFPVVIVLACSAWGFYALTRNTWHSGLRVGSALLAFLISHAVAGLTVYVYKDLDDNSYYAASVSTLLEEITLALSANESGFPERLKEFTSEQSLTYENRGNLLENARSFREAGQEKRDKSRE